MHDSIKIKFKKIGIIYGILCVIQLILALILFLFSSSLELGVLFVGPFIIIIPAIIGVVWVFVWIKEVWWMKLLYAFLTLLISPFLLAVPGLILGPFMKIF